MAGGEGGVLQHGQAVGAVTGGAVVITKTAVADVAGCVGNLPAISEQSFAYAQRGAVGQGQIVGWVSITEA